MERPHSGLLLAVPDLRRQHRRSHAQGAGKIMVSNFAAFCNKRRHCSRQLPLRPWVWICILQLERQLIPLSASQREGFYSIVLLICCAQGLLSTVMSGCGLRVCAPAPILADDVDGCNGQMVCMRSHVCKFADQAHSSRMM